MWYILTKYEIIIHLRVDIYHAASWLGKYPSIFTTTSMSNCWRYSFRWNSKVHKHNPKKKHGFILLNSLCFNDLIWVRNIQVICPTLVIILIFSRLERLQPLWLKNFRSKACHIKDYGIHEYPWIMQSPTWIKNGVGRLGKTKARGRVTSVTVDMINMTARNVPYIT